MQAIEDPDMSNAQFSVAVVPGDGIGHEITAPTQALLTAIADEVGGFSLSFSNVEAGAETYQKRGTDLPDETIQTCEKADAVLLAACGLPGVRYPDGREIVPQITLREIFGLYAGVRPVKMIPGVPGPLSDPRAKTLDFVLIRESTEGLFAGRGKTVIENDETARDMMEITRTTSERLFDFTFALARKRKEQGKPGIVTCVDKANVLGSLAFFRKVFDERAALNPDLDARHGYVDAVSMTFVRNPWIYDVLVTENMFGDILSDIGAGLMGGLGFAPSADIGEKQAVFQPCHGTAPDIAGKGLANPTAMVLSAAMMLEWLGEKHDVVSASTGGALLEQAVVDAYEIGGLSPTEIGGADGTDAIIRAIAAQISNPETKRRAAA